ncbi:MAG: hypothetical protein HC814_06770 [Rhodobacteraceae bacterium]|nr:hypothetical protein [Paracoccaceae bacterium]
MTQATKGGGLNAEYFQSKGMNKKDKKALERVDQRINFDFGTNSPLEDIAADQFSIAWNGSLLAANSGLYEFRITTRMVPGSTSTPTSRRATATAATTAMPSGRRP